jgi:TRAP-type C4-dicarboxylate transport system permease small subunit
MRALRVPDAGVCLTGVIDMSGIRIAAIALIVAGVLGLVYGGFTYTKETHEAQVGPLSLSVSENETINVPIWAGVGAIVIGGVLLVFGGRKG